jgi:hypothetical protein
MGAKVQSQSPQNAFLAIFLFIVVSRKTRALKRTATQIMLIAQMTQMRHKCGIL